MSGAYHFDSRSSTHLQSPRNKASQRTRSKPYRTNHREQEDPTWPFALSRAVFNSGVLRAKTILRKMTPCGIQITERCLPQPVTGDFPALWRLRGNFRSAQSHHDRPDRADDELVAFMMSISGNPEQWTAALLKEFCAAHGLKRTGKKVEQLER